jgi:hypothetical protein
MGKVVLDISMSLDGYVRASNPTAEEYRVLRQRIYPARVKVTCVTPLGEDVAWTS